MPAPSSMSDEADIRWGTVKNRSRAKTFYSSFISEGIEYELFDNVEVYNDLSDPYIGKVIKLWEERETGLRKALIRWFFKLKDLAQDMEGDPRELYLAFGTGQGVTNENDLEVICGKSKVLCTSKDARNRQPSARDIKNADFFFSKIYNVDLQHLSPVQRIADKLGCEAVYNKPAWVTEISKSKEKAVEQHNGVQDCNKGSILTQDEQCIDGSASDLNNRQRNSVAIIDSEKSCKGSDLKRKQTSSMNEVSQNKKSKTSATINTPSIKLTTANRIQKTSVTTNPQTKPTAAKSICESEENKRPTSSLGEAEASKRPTLVVATTNRIQSENVQKSEYVSLCEAEASKIPNLVATPTNKLQKSENFPSLSEAEASRIPTLVATAKNRTQKSENVRSLGEAEVSKLPTLVATVTKRIQKSEKVSSLGEAEASKIPTLVATATKRIQKSENVSFSGEADASKIPTLVAPATKRMQKAENVSSSGEAEASKIPTLVATATKRIQKSENVSSLGEAEAIMIPTLVVTATNRIQNSENVSSLGEVVIRKISASCDVVLPSNTLGQEEHMETNLPVCVPPETNLRALILEGSLSFGKTTVSETLSPKVDNFVQQKALANTVSFDEGRADLNVTKEASVDPQKMKDTIEGQKSLLSYAKNVSGLLRADAEQNLHAKGEIKSFARDLSAERQTEGTVKAEHKVGVSIKRKGHQAKGDSSTSPDSGNCFKESVVKEAMSGVTKKLILSTGSDSEKKLLSTSEPVKVVENRRIFKVLPWDENLQQGIMFEKVLLLQNLDPCLTSTDFCDMLKNILQGVSDAQIIPQDTACRYGQGLVIFESRLLAESAFHEMERKCLVMANNKRPIIASKFKEPTSLSRFPGHLALEKLKLSRNLGSEEYKKAVSTSHCSQPNTIEYEMAIEWRRLQEIIQTCKAELFERQRKEMEQISKCCSSEGH